jgi:hypothetical protein
MSLLISSVYTYDADVSAYILAVEAADGQTLEPATRSAINKFVVGCKADGIWTAIKASCILAGARTLTGALIPLVGTAPTNDNFVSGDYNRKTGLVGNGSTKRLNSNRNNRADPTNNCHLSVYATAITATATTEGLIGGGSTGTTKEIVFNSAVQIAVYLNSAGIITGISGASTAGFKGASRALNTSFTVRSVGSNTTATFNSLEPANENVFIFARGGGGSYTDARLAFYSIGESLDLALLDARVTDLINAFAVTIP